MAVAVGVRLGSELTTYTARIGTGRVGDLGSGLTIFNFGWTVS